MACAEEALRPTDEKANFQRLTRLLMRGGVTLLRETFDSIHPPETLHTTLSNPAIQAQLRKARLTRMEWNCLYPLPGVYGKSSDFDIILTFRLLRTISGLTEPATGWDNLPTKTDHSLEADLARVKYYRSEVYGRSRAMEISDAEFVDLWREISEALLRIAASISHDKRDKWKASIDQLLHDPLTPQEKICVEELDRWYKHDIDVKDVLEKLELETKSMFHEMSKQLQSVKDDVQQMRQPDQQTGIRRQIPDFRDDHKLQAQSVIKPLKDKAQEKRNEASKLDQDIIGIQMQVHDVKSKVQATADQLIAIIEASKQDILNKVDEQAQKSVAFLERKRKQVERKVETIENITEKTEELLKKGSSAEFRGLNETFKAIALEDKEIEGESNFGRIPRFRFTENKTLVNALRNEVIGSVKTVFNKTKAQLPSEVGKENSTAIPQDNEAKHACSRPFMAQVQTRHFKLVFAFGRRGKSVGMLSSPVGVAVNNTDEIAVADSENHRVSVFTADGALVRSFGKQGEKRGEFNSPRGIAFDKNGNIIVADCGNNRIQVFSGTGKFLSMFGDKSRRQGKMMNLQGLSVTRDGNIIVADSRQKQIKIFSLRGELIRTFDVQGSLSDPYHCVEVEQHFLVSDKKDPCIKVFDQQGKFEYQIGKPGNQEGEFYAPSHMSVNKDGHLVVCDEWNDRIQVITLNGNFVTQFKVQKCRTRGFACPSSTANLSDGRIVVAASENYQIKIFEFK